ncbi:DUF2637 domain-containing protein [Streptomyces benahoarensis]|uniref:DUF2637 domain-containing protein n=1 Tax=Streptomyces benahoarensis TaxID=2595054 RepID=A0A553ZRB9_9ACTN|nr:DUF2637 domain-containing protein [Streptomyces benahoarensis]TSB32377.1 DUF2637 domain-containing protein [Streptomyces benahoarensis]TSB44010.1 DUF2637 domain-containing protein [Streptomyces benahoarensis]
MASDDGVEVNRKIKIGLGVASILGGCTMGGIGFYLSFGNLSRAGHTLFGFSVHDGQAFAVGVDVAIVSCLVLDLFMACIRTSWPQLRILAHGMTVASVYFNARSFGSITEHWDKALAHGLMPILFVIGVEGGRRILVHQAALPGDHDVIPVRRWLLAFSSTWAIYRVMKIWGLPYSVVVARQRERAIFDAWTEYKAELKEAELEEGSQEALERLPKKLEPFGLTVDEAMALPDQMAREELRRQQQAEQRSRDLELERERAAHDAEKKRLAHRKEMVALTADLSATEGIAEEQARGAVAEARAKSEAKVHAATATTASEAAEAQQREAEARRKAAEAVRQASEAEETNAAKFAKAEGDKKQAAEDRRKAAEADRQAAEARKAAAAAQDLAVDAEEQNAARLAKVEADKRRAAEDRRKAAEANEAAAEAEEKNAAKFAKAEADNRTAAEDRKRAAEADQRAAEARGKAAEADRLAAEARGKAAEADRRAAEATRRAVEAEDYANLTQRQRRVRTVARMLLAAGEREVTNQEIADAIGVKSEGTASEHRTEAVALIKGGYPSSDPDVPSRTEA